jgi:hypothetical protein
MIAGAELAAWLSDRGRQEQSNEDAGRLARRWGKHPLIAETEAGLAALEDRSPAALIAAAERFMGRTDEISQLIREMIAQSAADPFFRPPFGIVISEVVTGFLLCADPPLTIALGVTSADSLAAKKSGVRGATSIGFTGLLTSYRWLKGGGATLSFWEAPRRGGEFTAQQGGHCRLTGRRTLADGDCFTQDGRYQSFVIEHATSDMICLQAAVHAEEAPLATEYDSRTLAYVGASSADEASSRTEMMVSLLRLMDRGDAIPEIAGLLDSSPFHTRWHVMREFLAMDSDAAFPHLQRMASSDPHPDVRSAAAQTLAMFFQPAQAA